MARELDATISKLQTGDMVIAPWGKGSIWKWSRVLEILGGDFVLVTEDPWESDIPSDISALTSATTSGAPLPTAMPNYMKGYNVLRKREVVLLPDELKPLLLSTASAKRLVDSPGERFHRDFMRSITGVIVNHLAKKGISMDLLDKAVAKNVHLRHEMSLLRMIDHLEAVISNNTDVEKICSILEELLNSGLIELNAEGAHPLLSDTARSLANFSVRRAVPGKLAEYVTKSKVSGTNLCLLLLSVTTNLTSFLHLLQRAIEDLRKERTAVLNGTRKSQLANWWLTAIQEKVNRFLEEQYGYDPCALPENYTEDRPKDIQPVQRNLDIVKVCHQVLVPCSLFSSTYLSLSLSSLSHSPPSSTSLSPSRSLSLPFPFSLSSFLLISFAS
jgi:hypothetical protein